MFPSTGHTLGHYRLLGRIGRGGMGDVFRAHDTRLQRQVAIKVLHSDTSGDERARRRLLREARAAAALSHPSIVTVYSVEEAASRCFIVMELVDGITLADRLANGPLGLLEICEIGAQISDALAAAHAAGIVHHDVTPRNILLGAGRCAKLADFGLSRALAPLDISLETTGTAPRVAGTLYYMSPEQVRGEVCTSSTDMFSLGSVLYHAATGQRPFEGANAFAVLDAILSVDPPPPSALTPGLPPAFDALLGRLMAKRVEDRTIEARQAAAALRSVAAGAEPVSPPQPPDALRHPPRFRATVVGRDRELARLSASFSRAARGTGTMVVITGDAGVGKTALVEAFLQAGETLAANALVCRGQSVEHSGAGEPYFPVIDALAPLVARRSDPLHEIVRTHAPSWRPEFPGVYSTDEVPPTPPTSARLARELGDALCAAARSSPVVMVLEDLHWADPSTIELLRHLAHRAARAALLVVATYRAEEAGGSGSAIDQVIGELEARGACETLDLNGLDEVGILEYLECRFEREEVAIRLAPVLFRATEGHPLFLVSLVQLLIERGDLQKVDDAWRLATPADRLHLVIPRTVQAVIRRKLAALEENDRRLLQHASIEGQEFSTAVLSALVDTDPVMLEERLDAVAKGHRIVAAVGPERYADGTWGARYRFAHAVYHNVVYDDLIPSRRADLHRRVAERLAALHPGRTAGIAAQLARHFKEGRDGNRAFDYYIQAGDHSMTLSAALEADGHYSQAVALGHAEGTRIDATQIALAHWKRAIARVFRGDSLAGLADYHEALIGASRTGDADRIFDIRLSIAYTLALAERIDEAIQAAAELERSAGPPTGSKRLRYLILDLQLRIGRGDFDQAAVNGEMAVALARSLGDSERLWHSLSVSAQLHYYRAEYGGALAALREVSSAGATGTRRRVDPRPLNVHFHTAQFLGLTLGDLGHVSEALATLHSALEIARADGYGFWIPRLLNSIGALYGEIGSPGASAQCAEDAVQAAAEAVGQDVEIRIESGMSLALASVRLGQLDRSADLLAQAGALMKQDVFHAWLLRINLAWISAEHALASAQPARAADLAREGAALARQYGVWKQVVIAERLLAEAAAAQDDWSEAAVHVQQALDTLAIHPVPIIAWKIHATAAHVDRHRGLHEEAATALEHSRTGVHQLSERIDDEQLKAAFLRLARLSE